MFNRILGGAAAIFFCLSLVLVGFLNQSYKDNGKLKQQLETAVVQVKQRDERIKRDAEFAQDSYESASESCRQSIRSAVAAVKVKVIEVPKYVEDGSPNPMCPVVSLRDVQDAGSSADSVSPSGNSGNPR